MKRTLFLLFMVAGLGAACSRSESAQLWVRGNCEMCKERIEKAITAVPGVTGAAWNEETQILTVEFEPGKKDEKSWSAACAAAGHDTKTVKADEAAYTKLPKCCKRGEDM